MALDEPKETDTVYDIDGFSYLVDAEFIEKVKPIKVDFVDIGFRLSCAVDFSRSCWRNRSRRRRCRH